MTIWIFPGQPLKCEATPVDEPDFLAISGLCRLHCGYDLIENQPIGPRSLSQHTCLQIYGVAMSLYRTRQLKKQSFTPDMIAEHSLGIYAALAACGSIGEADALELAGRIGVCMSEMQGQSFSLGCPIGLATGAVESAARNNSVFVANYNTSRHFLLAGNGSGIESALEECRVAGAFSVSSFPCEAPLHTPLMEDVTCRISDIISDYRFLEPQIPLIDHLSQTRLTASNIPSFLVDELKLPVRWEETWKFLRRVGISHCCEVGSGQSLTKFNRWIDSETT